jgi:outer membrane receptor protein involved in Fe transport
VDVRSREEMLELQHNWMGCAHNVVWGADFTRDVYDSEQHGTVANTVPADYTNDQVSAFAEDEITLAHNLWLTLGYRGQYNELTYYDWAGRSALIWEFVPKHFLRGAVSRSFRRPTIWEEFRAGPEEYGNTDLVNERMVSYELGYRGQWRQNLTVNVEGYVNQDTDMIAKQFDASWVRQYQNVYDVQTCGLETSIDWKPAPWWLVRGFHVYTHQTDRDELTNWRTGETQVLLGPKHRVGLTNRFYLDEAMTLNTQLYWTDVATPYPEYIPGRPFWKLDVRLARRIWNDRAEVAVGATNLNDPFHYEGGYDWSTGKYIEVPRIFYVQLFCKF